MSDPSHAENGLASFMLPALSMARERARRANCLSNQRQVILGDMVYADEYDDSSLYHETEEAYRIADLDGGTTYDHRTGFLALTGSSFSYYCPSLNPDLHAQLVGPSSDASEFVKIASNSQTRVHYQIYAGFLRWKSEPYKDYATAADYEHPPKLRDSDSDAVLMSDQISSDYKPTAALPIAFSPKAA